MASSTVWTLVDSTAQVVSLVNKLTDVGSNVPSLYLDLEGNRLGEGGEPSLMQLLHFEEQHVYLIDLRQLGKQAFEIVGTAQQSLGSILESPDIAKAFFDVRTDALALHQAYGVRLAGVHDIQLMDIATRTRPPRYLGGLASCIEYCKTIAPMQRQSCSAIKAAGHKLFAPEAGGSYAVFDVRPLSHIIKQYCVQDVLLLPTLWNEYQRRLGPALFGELLLEAERRICMVQQPGFSREGRRMNELPDNWRTFPRNLPRTWVNRAPKDFDADCKALRDKLFVLASEESAS